MELAASPATAAAPRKSLGGFLTALGQAGGTSSQKSQQAYADYYKQTAGSEP